MPESGHGSDACGSKWHAPPCSESAAQKRSFRPQRRGLELELIQTQMTQKPMLRAEVYARALRASQNRKEDSV